MINLSENNSLVAGTIPALLGESVNRRPLTTAVSAACGSITYEELYRRAGSLAGALRSAGVQPGSLVAVCLPRSIEQIVSLVAVWQAGAAYLPLDPAWPEARLALFVERADCAAVIAERSRADMFRTARVVQPGATGEAETAYATDPSDLAYVIYTSGSTGEPKAVEVTHGNLAALAQWHCDAFGVGAGTRCAHLAGLGFDAAAWEVWPALSRGGTLCLADADVRTDAVKLREWFVAHEVEVAFAPTALAEPMVQMDWPEHTQLRVLLTGADRLTVRPKAGLPFTFVNNYGPTECTVVATSGTVAPEGDALPSIGRPIAGTSVHLLDPSGAAVPAGSPGEIHIGGAQVARGYRGDPSLTDSRFIDHPEHGRLYRTGDLAFWLDNGELAFVGRVDSQAKVRGHRVEPAEVAAAMAKLPGIQSSHVVVRNGELVAYVVPSGGSEPTASSLRATLAQSLPDYMIPTSFARLDAMPLTANGKLDVRALPDPAHAPMAEAVELRQPTTPTERRLFEIISDVLGKDQFGIDDDFFLLGGHSLLGTQVIVRARDAFGIELSLLHLFEGPTVAKLAQTIQTLIFAKIDAISDEEIRRMSA